MKRLRTILLLLGILCAGGIILLLTPRLWQDKIEIVLNENILSSKGWQISIGTIKGHLFSTVIMEDILLWHQDGSNVLSNEVSSKINLIPLITGKLSLDFLKINEMKIALKGDSIIKSRVGKKIELDFPKFPFHIDDLRFNGKMEMTNMDTVYNFDLKFAGNTSYQSQELNIGVNNLVVNYGDSLFRVDLNESSMKIEKGGLILSHISGVASSIPFEGDLFYSWMPDAHFSGEMIIGKVSLPEDFFGDIPMKPVFSSLSTSIKFESDLTNFHGIAEVFNDLGLNLHGKFSLKTLPEELLVETIELKSDSTMLKVNGILKDSGRVNGNILLSNLDLNQWLIDQENTNISGMVLIEGLMSDGILSNLFLTTEVQESKLYLEDLVSISGTISYHDSLVEFIDPLTLSIGPSSIIMKGNVNLRSESIDLTFDMKEADVFIINNFWSDSLETGVATGQMNVSGSFTEPSLDADLFCRNILYKDASLEEMEIHSSFDNSKNVENGFAHIIFENGIWKDYHFDNGTVDLKFISGVVELENIQMNKGNDFLQLSGRIEENGNVFLDRLQVAYEGHYLALPSPLNFILKDESIIVKPFVLHVDDGVIEGYFHKKKLLDGRFKLSNIESSLISPFIQDNRFKISGMIFGEIGVHESIEKYNYSSDISLKKGSILGQKFDDLVVSLFVRDEIMHIEELTLINGDKTGLQVMGTLPLKSQNGQPIEINLNTKFSNLDLEILPQVIPDWFHLGGQISGNFIVGGTTEKTLFDFDVAISDAVFEKIQFGQVKGKGSYDGKNLSFSQFSSDQEQSHLEGTASLPFDYNIGSAHFGQTTLDNPLYLNVGGHTKDLSFITQYLTGVDSIIGDFNIKLGLNGTWQNLIRDGWIRINDAKIFTNLLKSPIDRVDGYGNLIRNRLNIESLNGIMVKSMEKQQGKNLFLTGSMDMSKFFQPYFDIWITGENIYFEALQEDIKGLVNLDASMKGKDEITISGKIPLLDVEMYKEFTSSNIAGSFSKEGRVSFNYKINFPIIGDFTLLNNQIDARFGGDINITKLGIFPADFSGEAIFEEGKFYYSGDIFTITEGYLIFDKKGFNPYFNMTAITTIDDEQIDISFTGPLSNPNLILTSGSGFSQSDILELLTWGKRFEDQEISYSGIGTRATSLVEGWLDTQLDRKLIQLSGLDQFGILKKVKIEGATSLLDPEGMKDFKIGANVTKTISFNYAFHRSFSLTNPNHAVGVEYKVNKYLSLIGDVDQNGKVHAKYKLRYAY